MFSTGKFILRLYGFRKAFHRCQSQTPGLLSHLGLTANASPKESYSLLFFDQEVQYLLMKISNIDFEKTFKPKPGGVKLKPPVYKLMTTEELEAEEKKGVEKAKYLLQIPPLVSIGNDEVVVIDSDTSLDGYDYHHSKHVFTDISSNENFYSRTIFIRESNGSLRTATRDERFRMNQIYYPLPGREIETPEMFEPEHLMNLICRKEYEFILDRACVQFEPDDLMYHKVITLTYEAINYCKDFEMLHSTRHFGSLAFYLVSHKNIDQMLDDNIENERIDDAVSLVQLYHKIHPDCKSAKSSDGKNDIEFLKNFINNDANIPSILNNTLENYIRKQENKQKLETEIKEAHGIKN